MATETSTTADAITGGVVEVVVERGSILDRVQRRCMGHFNTFDFFFCIYSLPSLPPPPRYTLQDSEQQQGVLERGNFRHLQLAQRLPALQVLSVPWTT